jgi:hypothetical protein
MFMLATGFVIGGFLAWGMPQPNWVKVLRQWAWNTEEGIAKKF